MKDQDWKLNLRYGKLKTPYKHYTAIAEGFAKKPNEEYSCPEGHSFMGLKTWAESEDESMDMVRVLSEQIGFELKDKIFIYGTEPTEPPRENPYGYDVNFTSFNPQEG